ncbi:integrase [Streptomyces agglomeratus]|uniref:Integrase n=1 Tax=Streptomyces agglomeratus TaxID=285458 RepID=A0A1E5P8D4_9ACTN|nr:site-specific integrase [Streptomyces agglomeratus]OEJ25816.1 integrase [Streptomyces agglomeratus]OEJ40127.1 integrase [Streptomyces agglomeratus]OEJ45493.1 integrase [Streptomyces agglomeratus]OEJ52690.1 integrase [Streptomyces agglomeratus]
MTMRRSRGDGGLHWDERRQRWIATANLGFDPSGKRIVRRGSGKTKTEAKNKLKEVLRDYEDGLAIAPTNYTVADAVNDWLAYGLAGRDARTVENCTYLSHKHVIPALGARKLRDLSAEDVDRWLAAKAKILSTRTLQAVHSCLNRSVKRAMARDKVKRNVVDLCSVPQGQAGRPSKALTFAQAEAVLKAAEGTSMHAYIVVALLTGARTEELRALTWDHVFLKGQSDANPPQPPHMAVWRSVRRGGDTKTRKSRRTLALPARCVEVLWQQFEDQGWERLAAGDSWEEHGLVFSSAVGKPLDATNVRRAFRQALKDADGINADDWTPRELRHSFVSLLSDRGVPLEEISRLVGHSGTAVTEEVYRKQIRPVIQTGAVVMDGIFKRIPER